MTVVSWIFLGAARRWNGGHGWYLGWRGYCDVLSAMITGRSWVRAVKVKGCDGDRHVIRFTSSTTASLMTFSAIRLHSADEKSMFAQIIFLQTFIHDRCSEMFWSVVFTYFLSREKFSRFSLIEKAINNNYLHLCVCGRVCVKQRERERKKDGLVWYRYR